MAIIDSLLPEFDQEIAGVRKTLERVPADKFEWRPHPRSATMISLAGHLANLPTWAPLTINQDELDTAPGGKSMDPPAAARRHRGARRDLRQGTPPRRARGDRRLERRRVDEAVVAAEERRDPDDDAEGSGHSQLRHEPP